MAPAAGKATRQRQPKRCQWNPHPAKGGISSKNNSLAGVVFCLQLRLVGRFHGEALKRKKKKMTKTPIGEEQSDEDEEYEQEEEEEDNNGILEKDAEFTLEEESRRRQSGLGNSSLLMNVGGVGERDLGRSYRIKLRLREVSLFRSRPSSQASSSSSLLERTRHRTEPPAGSLAPLHQDPYLL